MALKRINRELLNA
jgi:ubiquitin-protein ligase